MRDWAHSRRLGTPADEAGYVVLRQPPASKLANLFRIDVRDHALGLVTQQLGRSRNRAPAGWVAWATNAITEGRARFRIGTQWFSRSELLEQASPARPCGRGKLVEQFSLLQRFAVWWVAAPRPILPVAGGAFSSLSAVVWPKRNAPVGIVLRHCLWQSRIAQVLALMSTTRAGNGRNQDSKLAQPMARFNAERSS